jgi:hypothetical protein
MSYWIWRDDAHSEDQANLRTRPSIINDQGLYFDDGALMVRPEDGTTLAITLSDADDGFLTDNLVAPALPGLLISSRLRAVLDESGVDNIQYFPVDLTRSNGAASFDGYFIANIIGRVACTDFERSDIVMNAELPPMIDGINKLALDEDSVQDLDIFRLGELFVAIIVSSRLKDAIERSGVSGVAFQAVDEYIF